MKMLLERRLILRREIFATFFSKAIDKEGVLVYNMSTYDYEIERTSAFLKKRHYFGEQK